MVYALHFNNTFQYPDQGHFNMQTRGAEDHWPSKNSVTYSASWATTTPKVNKKIFFMYMASDNNP